MHACLFMYFGVSVLVAEVQQPLASPRSCASGACGALPQLGQSITGFAGINDGKPLLVEQALNEELHRLQTVFGNQPGEFKENGTLREQHKAHPKHSLPW